MRTRGMAAALVLAAAAVVQLQGQTLAKGPQAECGSYYTKAQEERFLHRRYVTQPSFRARALEPQAARANLDVGNIAVIGGGNGVVGTRNPIDLAGYTLSFTPNGAGFDYAGTQSDTYDATSSQNGTRLGLSDDGFTAISLPFAFPFLGTSYSSAFVNSNGEVTFGKGDADYSGEFGHLTSGAPAIAGLFTDLNPPGSSNGVRLKSEAGRVVISWDSVPLATTSIAGSTVTFQIRLFPSGKVELAYHAITANFDHGVVGVAPGGSQPVTLVDLTTGSGTYGGAIAEVFTSSFTAEVDMMAAAQRFYQTHEDAYDYLVFYNAMGVSAGSGIVAYELTTRSAGKGYGDTPTEDGLDYGSPKRLQAVLNLGPTTQYPASPTGIVPSRGVVGDTPLSILAHEAGHLFLALVSVPSPTNAFYPPMLGAGLAHWAFPYNSDASFLEGNRIVDQGAASSPRFRTTATVQHYSELDQYLMGLRGPSEVGPMFAVLNSGNTNTRAPQTGITFGGQRLDISINDVIAAAGRRTPDATIAQRSFRMAFVLIVNENADLSAGSPEAQAVAQIDAYRAAFETFFNNGTDGRATMTTTLQKAVQWSLAPRGGVLVASNSSPSTITLAKPVDKPLHFTFDAPDGIVSLTNPGPINIPTGASQVPFLFVKSNRVGVSEVRLIPDDPAYETVVARVAVRTGNDLHVQVVSGDLQDAVDGALPQQIVVRTVDENDVPFGNRPLNVAVEGGGQITPSQLLLTDINGEARFTWTTKSGSFNRLTFSIQGAPGSTAVVTALGVPGVSNGGVVNSASYRVGLAAGGFGSIFGGSLAAGNVAQSATSNFPTSLGGVTVAVNGSLARLSYVSDSLINFIVPANIGVGTAQLQVSSALGTSAAVPVTIAAHAPGVFFNSATQEGAILVNGPWVLTSQQPAQPGDYIAVFGTGLGTSPSATATIANVPVSVSYAGGTVIPGLDQVNILIPAGLPSGMQPLVLTVNGVTANSVGVVLQ